jgi:hypothetical protein
MENKLFKLNGKQVFRVHTHYEPGHRLNNGGLAALGRVALTTGHLVLAESIQDAERIAEKYKIGNPMGSGINWKAKEEFPPFNPARKYGGKVWQEINGELIGHETPLMK